MSRRRPGPATGPTTATALGGREPAASGSAAQRWLHRLYVPVTGLVVAVQLFVGTTVGMADNGDFLRLLDWFGLDHSAQTYEDRFFDHVDPRYKRVPGSAPAAVGFPSSAVLFLALGRVASPVFDGVPLHLHWLAVPYLLALLLALHCLLRATAPMEPVRRTVLLVGTALVVTDVAYVSYFNSVYSEPAGLVFLVGALAAGTGWASSGWRSRRYALAFWLTTLGLVTAKPQYMPLAFLVLAFAVLVARADRRWVAGGAALNVVAALALTPLIAPNFREANLYHGVFEGILPNTDSPEAALRALGLPEAYAVYEGTDAYGSDSGLEQPPVRRTLLAEVDQGEIITYYLSHPGTTVRLLLRGADLLPQPRPALGNFEQAAGEPRGAQDDRFSAWSATRRTVLDAVPPAVLLAALLAAGAALVLLCLRNRRRLGLEALAALAAACCLAQLGGVLVGNGDTDFVKQFFLGNVLLDLLLVALVAVAAGHARRLPRTPRPAWRAA